MAIERTDGGERSRRPSRVRRVALWTAAGLAVVLIVALVGGGWYYSDQIEADLLSVQNEAPEYDVRVLAVDADRVTLQRTDDTVLRGTYGLEWPGGYGQITQILEASPGRVQREFRLLQGSLSAGQRARVRSSAFPGDPEQAFGLPFDHTEYSSDLGRFPAWLVEGTDETWMIFVHGKGASREEALRALPTVTDLGYTSLVISYRNDPEAPQSPDGRYHFGDTEWRDLESAVRFTLDRGAQRVVLFGYSMGGAIVTSFLRRSDLAPQVQGAILEAPLLDVDAAVDLEGANRGLPQFLTSFAKWISSLRFGVDWDAWSRADEAAGLQVPLLLIHGVADETAPIEVSDGLAAAAPENVTYYRVPDAGHVRAWNVDPTAYEAAVRDFLKGLGS
ncbi:MAG: alpha/beta hydrolase [Actinomycetota bacterium]